MGEDLVLSRVDIDTTREIASLRQGDVALVNHSRQMTRLGTDASSTGRLVDSFSSKFVNLRMVASAALGGFTVAGAVFGIVSLTKQVIASTTAWKEWSAAIEDTFNKLVRGESQLEQTSRHIQAAASGTGVPIGMFAVSEQVNRLKDLGGTLLTRRNTILGGLTAPFQPNAKDALELREIEKSIGGLIDAFYKLQAASGLTQHEFDLLFGQHLEHGITRATRLTEGFNDELRETGEVIKKAIRLADEFGDELHEWWTDQDMGPINTRENRGTLGNLGFDRPGGLDANGDPLFIESDIGSPIDETREKFDMATAAVMAFGAALGDVAQGGGRTLKGFLGQMISMVGQAIIAWGALIVTEGIATWNPGMIAAGLTWMAIGAATVAVGNALAGRGGSASEGGRAAAAEPTQGGRSTQIIVVNEGTMIGNTPDQIIRWISEAQLRGGVRA